MGRVKFLFLTGIFFILFGLSLFVLPSKEKRGESVLSGQKAIVQTSPAPSEIKNGALSNLSQVLKVIDGDTIVVLINGGEETLRLIGIDTPETVDPRKPVQCFGAEASSKAKKVLEGQFVSLEPDPTQGERDKYSRLLRYVFLSDGTNFNLLMIKEGFAHEYTYDLPYKYSSGFKAAEKYARENNLGLWNPSSCPDLASQGETLQKEKSLESDYKPTGTYSCDCGKLCSVIKTCDEAYYQLKTCGCSARDSDGDGVPCESLCR